MGKKIKKKSLRTVLIPLFAQIKWTLAGPGHNQNTHVLSTHSTAMCQAQSPRSGLLELDLNYSSTDCHCVLGKQKTLQPRSANLVSSLNTSEVEEEREKDRNKTLLRLIISDQKWLLLESASKKRSILAVQRFAAVKKRICCILAAEMVWSK